MNQTPEQPPVRLLFFCVESQLCRHFFNVYVKKYREYVYVVDMTQQAPEAMATAKQFAVQSLPCLILLDMNGYEMRRWQGGRPPDDQMLRVEIGLGNAWGNV